MITTRTQKMCWRCALYHIALTIANRFVSPLFRFGSISSSSCHHSTYKSVFRWLNQRFVRIIVVFLALSMRTNRYSFLFHTFCLQRFFLDCVCAKMSVEMWHNCKMYDTLSQESNICKNCARHKRIYERKQNEGPNEKKSQFFFMCDDNRIIIWRMKTTQPAYRLCQK